MYKGSKWWPTSSRILINLYQTSRQRSSKPSVRARTLLHSFHTSSQCSLRIASASMFRATNRKLMAISCFEVCTRSRKRTMHQVSISIIRSKSMHQAASSFLSSGIGSVQQTWCREVAGTLTMGMIEAIKIVIVAVCSAGRALGQGTVQQRSRLMRSWLT